MYNISISILNDIFKDTKIDSSWRVFVEHWIIGVQQKNIKKLQTFCRRITGFSIKNQNYLPLLSKPVSYRYLGQIVSLYGDTNIIKGLYGFGKSNSAFLRILFADILFKIKPVKSINKGINIIFII